MKYIEKLLNGAEVKWMPLGEVAEIKTGQVVSKNVIAENAGEFPVINSGREPLGFINIWNTDNDPIGITSRGAGVGSVTWQEGKYFRGNLNYSVSIKDSSKLNTRYLYYLLLQMQINIQALCTFQGIPALNAVNLKKLLIPLPTLSVQLEIVRILDKFTTLEAELEAELDCRKRQYEYYRNQLLSLDVINNKGNLNNVEVVTLGEIAEYSRTRISSSDVCENTFVGVDNLLQNKSGKTISTHVPTEGNLTAYQMGDVLIGNIRPYLKKIWQANNNGGASGDVLVIHLTNEKIIPRYLYQVLADDMFFTYNMQYAKGAKMPRGNKQKIMEYKIPIPPLAEQQRIVSILDKFEALTTSISEGLPKEIALRRKQYEYYRNQLLSFA